jgi:MYXO-CTERM domain-containing protein
MRTYLAGVAIVLALCSSAAAQGDLTVSFTTTPNGGPYAPRNVVAVWIEDGGGAFVKTIGRWANVRKQHLVAWATASGQDADAVSGATRLDHAGTLTATWDLKDRGGAIVPDGTYTIRMELADANSTTPAQNHQGTFVFTKSPQSSSDTTSGGGFDAVTIDYVAAALSCAQITACSDGDGCCPGGCDESSDADCEVIVPPGDPPDDDGQVTGGCSSGSGSGSGGPGPMALAGLVLGVLLLRRRRRR